MEMLFMPALEVEEPLSTLEDWRRSFRPATSSYESLVGRIAWISYCHTHQLNVTFKRSSWSISGGHKSSNILSELHLKMLKCYRFILFFAAKLLIFCLSNFISRELKRSNRSIAAIEEQRKRNKVDRTRQEREEKKRTKKGLVFKKRKASLSEWAIPTGMAAGAICEKFWNVAVPWLIPTFKLQVKSSISCSIVAK